MRRSARGFGKLEEVAPIPCVLPQLLRCLAHYFVEAKAPDQANAGVGGGGGGGGGGEEEVRMGRCVGHVDGEGCMEGGGGDAGVGLGWVGLG